MIRLHDRNLSWQLLSTMPSFCTHLLLRRHVSLRVQWLLLHASLSVPWLSLQLLNINGKCVAKVQLDLVYIPGLRLEKGVRMEEGMEPGGTVEWLRVSGGRSQVHQSVSQSVSHGA
eukprot:GHVU01035709.1.p3 GENE.GHVU01035709.1~~GHVU01035709.1.p3  ORF type:complete len:116 (+),score=5.55 GHVU01035709.1:261-608(+)